MIRDLIADVAAPAPRPNGYRLTEDEPTVKSAPLGWNRQHEAFKSHVVFGQNPEIFVSRNEILHRRMLLDVITNGYG